MLNQLFISDAMAQSAAAAPEFSLSSFVPLILIFGVFYFLIIRPQSKKYKEHQALVESIKANQKIITTGGILGTVKNVNKNEGTLDIEIADNVVIQIVKNHVAEVKDSKKEKSASKATKNNAKTKK